MKKELLLPAGSMEALVMAIHNGADAIYVGGKKFGARAFAPNFDEEDLKVAIDKCHIYDVKLYVTVNTMIFERELEEVLDYVKYLYSIHVDALIVSDLGLVSLVHEHYPLLEIHLSTQAHTFSAEQMYFWKDLGVSRIVVDRELSLKEIEALPDILDIEVFIHGALCVCYSGQCYLSFMNLLRSGNRGSCAQLCRMPYELYYKGEKQEINGKYLLSTKEMNASPKLEELMNSKVKSFKIEGRMKSPEYVGFVAKYYRNLMDDFYRTGYCKVNIEEEKKLKYLFNRDFTTGYLFQNENIMNFKTSNHQGNIIGNVIEVNQERIKIKLSESLVQEDGIRFEKEEKGMIVNFLYNNKGLLIHEAKAGDVVFLDNKIGLQSFDIVRKTIDKKLVDSLKITKEKKIPIEMEIIMTVPNFILKLSDGQHSVFIKQNIVEKAKKIAMTENDIKKQMLKLGNTPFSCNTIKIQMEADVFVTISKLNEIRREGIAKLINERITL